MPDAPASAPAAAPAAAPPSGGAAPIAPTPPAQSTPPKGTKPPARESAYDELDRLDKETAKPKPAPKKEGKEAPPTSPAKPAASVPSADKKDAAATDTPTDDSNVSSAATTDGKPPLKVNELRTAYENLKREHAKLKSEAEKSKAAPPVDPDKPKLLESLEAHKKRVAELESELKYTAYEKSQEYVEKYQRPFEDAYQNGRRKAAALKVTAPDGTERQGTQQDFDAIMSIGDDGAAANKAVEMFGNLANLVLYHREKVMELNHLRNNAVEDYRKHGGERENQRMQEIAARRAQHEANFKKQAEQFQKLNSEAIEKYPQYFKADDGDDEGKGILEKGFARADRAFSGDRTIPPDELVELHSAMRNKAAAFDYLVYKGKQSKARITELEKELAEFKKSEPGADGGRHPQQKGILSFEDEIDALDRQR